MMRWFGLLPFAACCDDLPRAPIPIGAACAWCEERIAINDHGLILSGGVEPLHHECFIRQVVGSVAHQQRRCSCYGGHDEDPPDLSRRDAARLALLAWMPCRPN
jgi:hypothetical protein